MYYIYKYVFTLYMYILYEQTQLFFFPFQVEERFGPLIPQESSDQEAEPWNIV